MCVVSWRWHNWVINPKGEGAVLMYYLSTASGTNAYCSLHYAWVPDLTLVLCLKFGGHCLVVNWR